MNELDQAIQRDVFATIGQQAAEIITLRHRLAAAEAGIAELEGSPFDARRHRQVQAGCRMTTLRGKVSHFGGPDDMGVSPSEGLAFIYKVEDAPWLFLPSQPPGTTGLARRLDPEVYYIATRWDYDDTPKTMLPTMGVLVRAPKTGREFMAFCADWGPNTNTGRVADISPGLMEALGIKTDDEVEVIYPYEVEEPHVMPRIAMSSGHSTRCQGAIGLHQRGRGGHEGR